MTLYSDHLMVFLYTLMGYLMAFMKPLNGRSFDTIHVRSSREDNSSVTPKFTNDQAEIKQHCTTKIFKRSEDTSRHEKNFV